MLASVRTILSQTAGDAIGSQALIDELTTDTTAEWAEWGRGGKPITQRQLATLLKPFHIFPDRIQIGNQQVRGYKRTWFEDAFERYLPPISPPHLSVKASEGQ
jgi:putative DNA primase/helicase